VNIVKQFRLIGFIAAIPLASLLTGCSGSQTRYTPTSNEARASLEAALTAWRDGKPFDEVAAKPPVHVVDSAWRGGQQLESFQIGDEEDGGDGSKQFVVKLTMKKAKAGQDVRYFVNGRDPVWIFSEEDYKHMANMDGKPAPASTAKRASGRSNRDR
jgi:hypothetical protein